MRVNHNELAESTATNGRFGTLTHMGLRERLIEVMDAVGSDAELARLAEVSKTATSEWRSGRIKSLKAVTAINIQERTGYSARWLILGFGPKKLGDKGAVGALTHIGEHALTPPNDKKLLVVLKAFLDTDQEGRDQIVEAVKAITQNGHGQRRDQPDSVKRRRGRTP